MSFIHLNKHCDGLCAENTQVAPCLFINKIDRLILELRLTPAEAYTRLQSIVTHANMIMSAFKRWVAVALQVRCIAVLMYCCTGVAVVLFVLLCRCAAAVVEL